MQTINCYIPLKLRLRGEPGEDDWVALEEVLVDQYSSMLKRSVAELARPRFSMPRTDQEVKEALTLERVGVSSHLVAQVEGSITEGSTIQTQPDTSQAKTTGDEATSGHIGDQEASAAEMKPPPQPDVQERDYAFFYVGGKYGQAAQIFLKMYYPDHRQVSASSFEEMFDRLWADIRKTSVDRRIHIREIVIVTHANAAGGMKIPLTRGDQKTRRFFSPHDLVSLQKEFRASMHQRFRQRRREVVAQAIDEQTNIVVRGCQFGQSQEALEALRSFFGGQPRVWAPVGYQGFETLPIGRSILRTPEQAFDFLIQQGYLPPETQPAPDEEKRAYIARVFGLHGEVPAEFFVVGEEHYNALEALLKKRQGVQEEAEEHKTREPAVIPSVGEFWRESDPGLLGTDPELDSLTTNELEQRARRLNNPYRPENAAMLQRLRRAWERKSLSHINFKSNDPLAGLPDESIFGDPNIIAMDAARFPGPRVPQHDVFEEGILFYGKKEPDKEQREAARTFLPPPGTTEVESAKPVEKQRRPRGPAKPTRNEALVVLQAIMSIITKDEGVVYPPSGWRPQRLADPNVPARYRPLLHEWFLITYGELSTQQGEIIYRGAMLRTHIQMALAQTEPLIKVLIAQGNRANLLLLEQRFFTPVNYLKAKALREEVEDAIEARKETIAKPLDLELKEEQLKQGISTALATTRTAMTVITRYTNNMVKEDIEKFNELYKQALASAPSSEVLEDAKIREVPLALLYIKGGLDGLNAILSVKDPERRAKLWKEFSMSGRGSIKGTTDVLTYGFQFLSGATAVLLAVYAARSSVRGNLQNLAAVAKFSPLLIHFSTVLNALGVVHGAFTFLESESLSGKLEGALEATSGGLGVTRFALKLFAVEFSSLPGTLAVINLQITKTILEKGVGVSVSLIQAGLEMCYSAMQRHATDVHDEAWKMIAALQLLENERNLARENALVEQVDDHRSYLKRILPDLIKQATEEYGAGNGDPGAYGPLRARFLPLRGRPIETDVQLLQVAQEFLQIVRSCFRDQQALFEETVKWTWKR